MTDVTEAQIAWWFDKMDELGRVLGKPGERDLVYEEIRRRATKPAAPSPAPGEAIEALLKDGGAYLSVQFLGGDKPWEVQLHRGWGFEVKYGETLGEAIAALARIEGKESG